MKKTKKEILKSLNKIAKSNKPWMKEAQYRVDNHGWLQHSQKIALKILRALRAQGMSQINLAEIMSVSPQQVNKWVKGGENFKLDTIGKLEAALKIQLIDVSMDSASTTKASNVKVIKMEIARTIEEEFVVTSKEAKIKVSLNQTTEFYTNCINA